MPHKKTTEEFISDAKRVHGDKYDYSKVEYINSSTKVTIICSKHGEFEQIPNNHIRGADCFKCGIEKTASKLRKTNEQFISQALYIHGDKYNYDKCIYTGDCGLVTIICNKCKEEFEQQAGVHIAGHGCPKCAVIQRPISKRKSTEEFISDAIRVHGDKYDYSKTDYFNSTTNIIIICKKQDHGEFSQVPSGHLQGYGCPKCGLQKVIETLTDTREQFIEKATQIHRDRYDYSEIHYVRSNIKVLITCRICCHKFEQTPNSHLQGAGCPSCVNKTEGKLLSWLKEMYPKYQIRTQFSLQSLPKRKFDFLIEELKILIELDGAQHFCQVHNWQSPLKTQQIDCWKTYKALEEGYTVIRLSQEDVWEDKNGWREYLQKKIHPYDKPIRIYSHRKLYADHLTCYDRLREHLQYRDSYHTGESNAIKEIVLKHFISLSTTFSYEKEKMLDAAQDIQSMYPEMKDKENRDCILFFLCNILFLEVDINDSDEWTIYPIIEL